MGAAAPTHRVTIVPGGDLPSLLGYWGALDRLYLGFAEAARRVEAATGQPICVPGCGLCCQHNTVHVYGVEAEYSASFLLGQPDRLKAALDACREWLTKPGDYTYGRGISMGLWDDLVKRGELMRALTEDCPFQVEATRECLIHSSRPAVCRAYGVTRLPGRDCPRPVGMNETADSRCWWDAHHRSLPLYDMMGQIVASIKEPRYSRQGFLPMMLFERFRAKELAGLLDDGKVPLVKVAVGQGAGYSLLWQDEMEAQWSAIAADLSIGQEVPLAEREGRLVHQIGGHR